MRNSPPLQTKGLMTTGLLVITLWGISEARPFLIPISIAALLAFMMAPWVRLMKRYHFPEWSAIAASSLLLILPFLSLISILIWQGQALYKDLPAITVTVNHALSSLVRSHLGRWLHLAQDLDLTSVFERFEVSAGQGIQLVVTGLGAVLGAGSQLALVILFAVLMLASREHLRRSSERILEQTFSAKNPDILDEVVVLVEKFLIARLLIVIIIGGVDTIFLYLFDVRYALLLGSFLGVMTLIPAIGFIIGVTPPILVSLAMGHGILKTLGLVLVLFGMSIVEGNILTPKMVGKRLNINALTTFIGLFGGGLLWGVWGMFLSIPILGVLRITLNATPALRPWGELLAEKDEKAKLLETTPSKSRTKDRVA